MVKVPPVPTVDANLEEVMIVRRTTIRPLRTQDAALKLTEEQALREQGN